MTLSTTTQTKRACGIKSTFAARSGWTLRAVGRALVFAGSALLAGCSVIPKPESDPTRHYVLTGPAIATTAAVTPAGTLRVGLNPVRSAPYLDGKAMIVRRGENEIVYRDFARWAEPLSLGVGRMVAARLLASGQVGRVYPHPFPLDAERDIDVSLSILHCEGVVKADGTAAVSFVCTVELTDARADGAVRMRRVFTAPETVWTEGDYSALARQLSDAVAELSAEVLAALPAR